ncbi:MAG: oxidoreductase [Bacteroidetes bacterium]|nr:oxidoreductase [Bacteroidota bacterium]MBS1649613.1 oxidoreductase [Bacteroidota bacterium]
MKKIILVITCFFSIKTQAQTIEILTKGNKTSIRGLSVVNDNIFWASGSNGMIAKSTNGGKTIEWQQVKGYEKRDFRDIEAFDSNTAIIMGVDWPAVILKTKDGGKNWYKVFEDSTKGMFLDAMDFDGKNGVVIGDPINDTAFIAMTDNGGERWTKISKAKKSSFKLNTGEAFFASSGTNIKLITPKDERPYFFCVSGGLKSRLFSFDKHIDSLQIIQGTESTGANSMDVNVKSKRGIVVGGDFTNDKNSTSNCILIDFTKESKFSIPQTPPHGYRSCVIYVTDKKLITCGTSGIDISNDGGNNWQLISNESFHVVQKAKKGKTVYLAGAMGRIAKVIF